MRLAKEAIANAGAAEHIPFGYLTRLFVALGNVDLLQVAEILRSDLVAFRCGRISIDIPQLYRRFEERRQSYIRIAMLGAPHHRFGAQQTRNPDRRVRLLNWQAPRIDETIMEVLAFITEGTRLRPRLNHHLVRFVEILAVEGGIRIRCELLAAATAHPSCDQAAAGDHIYHAELFGQPQGISHYW